MLLQAGVDPNYDSSVDGWTALIIACHNGHFDVVNELIGAGAVVDKPDSQDGVTGLFLAAQEGHLKIVERLLKAGATIDLPRMYDLASPLFIASFKGNLDVVKFLLWQGADASLESFDGVNAEGVAWESGHDDVATYIRDYPNVKAQLAVKLSISHLKKQGRFEVIDTLPANDLTKEDFVFKVIEMMMACGMEPLADQVVSYVGINRNHVRGERRVDVDPPEDGVDEPL
jgi:ankyrin repeat protein